MKTKVIQNSFTSGEVTPLLFGRTDTAKYASGVAQSTNFIVRPQGPLWRRSGSKVVNTTKFNTRKCLIRKFQFSDLQSYQLEVGHLYVRIYFDYGFVETAPGSGVPLEVVTPYQETDLPLLKFTQSADELYITHPSYQTRILQRLGANSWDIVLYDAQDGPYLSTFNLDQSNIATITNVNSQAIATATTAIFSGAAAKTVLSMTAGTVINSTYALVRLQVTAHGFTTGNSINLSGVLAFSSGIESPPLEAAPYSNGTYVITVVDTNHFDLQSSLFYRTPVATFNLTNAKVNTSVAAANFVEFREANLWNLAKILAVITTTVASVNVIPYIKQYDPSVVVAANGVGGLSSDHSGVFSGSEIGQYIRTTVGTWWRITGFQSDSQVLATALTLVPYVYPATIVNVSASSITATVNSNVANTFASTDVGRHMRFNFGGNQPWAKISAVADGQNVSIVLFQPIPFDTTNINSLYGGGITSIWKLGAWSDTTGWPRAITFHQQRLTFGGTNTEPDTFWGSQSGDYANMAPTALDPTNTFSTSDVTDDCSLTYTIVSNEANAIEWMQSGPVLLIGTIGGEWQVKAASSTVSAITPTNINVTPQTNYGSKPNIVSNRIGYAVMFIQLAGRKVIELTYNFELDSYVGRDLTVVSEHILRKGGSAIEAAYQREPNSILWVALTDGTLAAMTYEKDQEVLSWHSHALGANTDGVVVESICVTPSPAGTEDQLYMITNRTINGSVARFIEVMLPDYYPANTQDKSNMIFLDCSSQYIGSAATTITGLGYLANETVSVVANGSRINDLVVSGGGTITLPKPATNVVVGYGYKSIAQILPLDGGSKDGGSAQGKQKRVARLALRLYSSLGFKYGTDLANLDEQSFRDSEGEMDVSPDIISGDMIVDLSMDYTLTGQFYVVQDEPYPLNLLALMPDVEVTQ